MSELSTSEIKRLITSLSTAYSSGNNANVSNNNLFVQNGTNNNIDGFNISSMNQQDVESMIKTLSQSFVELMQNTSGAIVNTSTNNQTKVDTTNTNATSSSGATISSLSAEIEQIRADITKLQQQIQGYDQQIATLEAELRQKNEEMQREQEKLQAAQNEYTSIENQIERNKSKYENITQNIESATNTLEQEAKSAHQRAVYKAMQDYNEAEDGDWNAFLQGRLENLEFGSSTLARLTNLNAQSKSIMRELGTLKTNLFDKADEVNRYTKNVENLNTEITTLNSTLSATKTSKKEADTALTQKNTDLNTKTSELNALKAAAQPARSGIVQNSALDVSTEITQMTQDELKNLVSAEELALVDANGINLTEKMANGSPRYVFAQGQEDNKYHIYDMQTGDSLARAYGSNGGYSIVSKGNGRIRNCNFLDSETGNGKCVYYLCDEETVKTCKACYSTCSPLSFDINGDGINTSNDVIDYDIDGDGATDKIYDSADAVLVFDKDGDGISGADGSECFGNNTDLDGDGIKDGFKDGFEALKTMAEKENLIGENDSKLDESDLKYLQEKYGLKIKTDGYDSEAESLLELGITEINLAQSDETVMNKNYDGKGNDLMTQEGATFKINGETKSYADIWHKKLEESETSQNNQSGSSSISFLSLNKKVNPNKITSDFDELSADKKKAYDKIDKILKKYTQE